jgi:hypothetical protein
VAAHLQATRSTFEDELAAAIGTEAAGRIIEAMVAAR